MAPKRYRSNEKIAAGHPEIYACSDFNKIADFYPCMANIRFDIATTDLQSKARAGKLTLDHGELLTPVFMPVGTVGAVKALTQQQLMQDVRSQIILANTYHLYLRPGQEVIQAAGGLHRFIGWDRPLLTDSGGYQVFSLSASRKIREEGVLFQSHIDGSRHLFSPEKVVDIQRAIGADIIMAFDECTPFPCEYGYAKKSLELTHRWLDRCLDRFFQTPDPYGYSQHLFPIVQGGTFLDLRKASAEYISSKNAAGNAIGGLSVGEPEQQLYEFCEFCCDLLPAEKPRYLMGVGTPWNILEAIGLGVDMFDCVMPTRNGRNAMLFTSRGVINIDNKKWEKDYSPIDDGIDSESSHYYSKAYLRHLMKSKEISGLTIASMHNLAFYLHLVREARIHILNGGFRSWKTQQVEILQTRL
jgi:queuine tRNA-ribosyltransferase